MRTVGTLNAPPRSPSILPTNSWSLFSSSCAIFGLPCRSRRKFSVASSLFLPERLYRLIEGIQACRTHIREVSLAKRDQRVKILT